MGLRMQGLGFSRLGCKQKSLVELGSYVVCARKVGFKARHILEIRVGSPTKDRQLSELYYS